MKKYFGIMVFAIFLVGCGDDDNGRGGIETVPPRPLSEVALEDDEEIRLFLQTHYYNYEEFNNPPADFDFNIRIEEIGEGDEDKTPLMEQVEQFSINISAEDFLIAEGEDNIPHNYYVLTAKEGAGLNPTFADSTFVRFEGSLLNGQVFDQVTTVSSFDLPSFQVPGFGSMRAFRGVGEGIQRLRAGDLIVDNPDGSFEVPGRGIGLVIFPSGLGTFNGLRSPIPQFSPLMFKLEILTTIRADHDNDGIPSFMEDIDGDGNVINDNTDGDTFGLGILPNYLDNDDDNDGIPTRDEIIIADDGTLSFPDSDGDGMPDYLDADS